MPELEADTCRRYVVPRLSAAGWDAPPHAVAEQQTFTDGRIVVAGRQARRLPRNRLDYLLRYTRDFPIAVVEAKRAYTLPADGLQQGKDYAEQPGLPFANATNGVGIVEFDYTAGASGSWPHSPPRRSSGRGCARTRGLASHCRKRIARPRR